MGFPILRLRWLARHDRVWPTGKLAPRVGDVAEWSHVLSLGERQRVAFARVPLARPKLIVLDEATWALEVEAER